jgi:hypothetical protein
MLGDIEIYLPKYLSAPEQVRLFDELKQFPSNIDRRIYTTALKADPELFQGDGLTGLPIISLPDTTILAASVMVVSNTCDITRDNRRVVSNRILYCPIIRLSAYEEELNGHLPGQGSRIASHIQSIKRQECSSMFYLPPPPNQVDERIALFDRTNNYEMQKLDIAALVANRLFTLSDYGFYLFVYKLSVHFTRLRENVSRG